MPFERNETPIERLTRPTAEEQQKRHWLLDAPVWGRILELLPAILLCTLGISLILYGTHTMTMSVLSHTSRQAEIEQEQFETAVGMVTRSLIEAVDQQGTQIRQLEERLQKLETPTHTE